MVRLGAALVTAVALHANAAVPCNVDNTPSPTTIISPANGASFSPAPQSITFTITASSGTPTVVYYYANGVVIGSATASPWSLTWTNVPAGTYSVQAKTTAKAVNCVGTGPLSSPVSVKVNTPPTVSISAPASGSVSTAPGAFTFTASAADTDGTVATVQWFANGSAISGALTSAPYAFAWSAVAAGSYSITARATDNNGAVTTSSPITVVSNDRPTITLSTSNANAQAPGSITLQATAGDTIGGVSNVQYFRNGTALSGALTIAPYAYNWTGVAGGTYSIVARVTDAYGVTKDSSPYSWTVNQAPSVSISAPANNTVSTAPGSFTFSANASDTDGSIASVQYFANGTAISAALTSAPYAYTWSGVASGSYSVTAKATDKCSRRLSILTGQTTRHSTR